MSTLRDIESRAPADEEKDEAYIDEDDAEDAYAQADYCNEYSDWNEGFAPNEVQS